MGRVVRTTSRIVVLPLAGILAGLVAALLTTAALTPTYDATASVFVGPKLTPGAADDVTLAGVSLAQNLVSSVAQLAQSRDVASAVASELGLPETKVAGHLTGMSQAGIQIVKVEAASPSATGASAMANAAASAIVDVSTRLRLGGSSVGVQLLDTAGIPTSPTTPRPALNGALGALVGLLAGMGALTLRTRMADRFARVVDIESELGLPALGVIMRRRAPQSGGGVQALYASVEVGAAVDGLVSALSVLIERKDGRRIVVTSVGEDGSAGFVAALLSVGLRRPDHGATLLDRTLVRKADPGFDRVGTLLADLSSNGADVVVAAPPVLAGRGLSELAPHADAVILAVDSDRARRAEAGRASLLVRRLGVPLAGIVVTGSAADEDGSQPSAWPIPVARAQTGTAVDRSARNAAAPPDPVTDPQPGPAGRPGVAETTPPPAAGPASPGALTIGGLIDSSLRQSIERQAKRGAG